MTKINIEKINKLSDDVDKNALKVKNMVELQQKESLESTTFLLQNMDHIKYVLATHKFINDTMPLLNIFLRILITMI